MIAMSMRYPARAVLSVCLMVAACAASVVQPESSLVAPSNAVQCSFYCRSPAAASIERTLTVREGETLSDVFHGLTFLVRLDRGAFVLMASAGERERFRNTYRYSGALPDNGFPPGDSFTGAVLLVEPESGADFQISCKTLVAGKEPDRASRERAQRERAMQARVSALLQTLTAMQPCELSAEQQQASERCAPTHSLVERVDAAITLHQLGERKLGAIDLADAQLAQVDLRETALSGALFDGANLSGALLYFSTLSRARVRHANLTQANLYGATLQKADFSAACLEHAKLQNVRAQGADFERVDMQHAYVMGALLDAAHLKGANLAEAHLNRVRLVGADLQDANLQGAALSFGNLERADLTGADLTGADLSETVLDGADLSSATGLTQAQLDGACGDARTRLPQGLQISRHPRPFVVSLGYAPCDLDALRR